jgi:hypothetical protein
VEVRPGTDAWERFDPAEFAAKVEQLWRHSYGDIQAAVLASMEVDEEEHPGTRGALAGSADEAAAAAAPADDWELEAAVEASAKLSAATNATKAYLACVDKKNERFRAARQRDEQDEARQRAEREEAMALEEATALADKERPAVEARRREEALLEACEGMRVEAQRALAKAAQAQLEAAVGAAAAPVDAPRLLLRRRVRRSGLRRVCPVRSRLVAAVVAPTGRVLDGALRGAGGFKGSSSSTMGSAWVFRAVAQAAQPGAAGA